jgi:hypothetical protein
MSEDCRELIPDHTLLVRGIRESEINRHTGLIKKSAFIPRRNGRDDDGLSVSQPGNDSLEQLKTRLCNREGRFCSLLASAIRAIEAESRKLDVCPSPTERDPLHALIKGVPTGREEAVLALANRLAERLAKASDAFVPSAA